MASLNKVFLIGNLTRDPELRVTPKGTAICQFGLAVNRQFKDDSGATRDETTFVDIEAWGKQGELVSKYLGKGSQCMVEGRLKLDQWEDKASGQKRSRLKVVLDNVQFLGAPRGAGGAGAGAGAASSGPTDEADQTPAYEKTSPPPRRAAAPPAAAPENLDEDVPF
ncbi:MAG TPA: single-stranded DNA-binding protein [Opitutaceae bacterium]|jgi:single-strand DNA-binding protein|nr:single-stranded DNA-binding protein [Opitutaceae bacterium]HRE05105.1 single-stranded DNA-binding protein [Opitutaceae bacterium]